MMTPHGTSVAHSALDTPIWCHHNTPVFTVYLSCPYRETKLSLLVHRYINPRYLGLVYLWLVLPLIYGFKNLTSSYVLAMLLWKSKIMIIPSFWLLRNNYMFSFQLSSFRLRIGYMWSYQNSMWRPFTAWGLEDSCKTWNQLLKRFHSPIIPPLCCIRYSTHNC